MIEFDQVSMAYNGFWVIQDFNLKVESGTIVTLFGPSGCGKSTLLKLALGQEVPMAGHVKMGGEGPGSYNQTVAYVPQGDELLPWLSLYENLKVWAERSEMSDHIEEVLETVGLKGNEHKLIGELSGGMKKRTSLARVFLTNSKYLLLDEALISVERSMRRKLMIHLRHFIRENDITALIVSHDHEEAVYMSDRIIVLSHGPSEIVRDISINNYLPEKRQTENIFEKADFRNASTLLV